MREIKNCPICNATELKKIKDYTFKFPGKDVSNHLHESTYVRLWILFEKIITDSNECSLYCMLCKKCGFIFLNPRLTENEVYIKYNMINELGSVKYRLKKTPGFNLNRRANRVFSLINMLYKENSKSTPKILDYGGSSGYILNPFINKFQCFILDYQKWKLPEGINYLGNDLQDLKENDKFDIILVLHTLEHVVNPKEFLIDISKHLNKNGIIYIEVPLGCFYEWKHLKDPLTHVNFFSEESLFKCFKLCNLSPLHLKTSVQWVLHGNMLCVNIIGTKIKTDNPVKLRKLIPTNIQISKFYHYQYYYYFLALMSKISTINPSNMNNIVKILKERLF